MYLITGMHRSGTSMVAKLFYKAGADFGDSKTFYPADEWNPEGYFEQPEIHAVNMPLINGPWGKWAYFHLPSAQTIISRSAKMTDQMLNVIKKYEHKVVKETRFSLTLPAWIAQGLTVNKLLLCLRDPIQVARSVKKRNKVPLSIGLNLWFIHNYRLMKFIEERKTPFRIIYYNSLLSREKSFDEIKACFRFFEMQVPDQRIAQIMEECVKPGLNHYEPTDYSYPAKVQRLWSTLKDCYKNQSLIAA